MRRDLKVLPLELIGETGDGLRAYKLVGSLDAWLSMQIEVQGFRRTPDVTLRDGSVIAVAYVRGY